MLNIYCTSINQCAVKCKHLCGVLHIITARVFTVDKRSTWIRAFEL